MTNKLVTADAAKLLVDGGTRRLFRVDSHIGERGFCGEAGSGACFSSIICSLAQRMVRDHATFPRGY